MARSLPGILGLVLLACGSPAPPPVVDVPAVVVVTTPEQPPAPLPVATADGGAALDHPSVAEDLLRKWSEKSRCDDFDYGREGGIKTFWCHRPVGLELADVARLAGVDIYSTPAVKGDFGHYNPAFVRWLIDKAAPNARDSDARAATQAAFDAHLRPLAEIFHYTLEKARTEPECFNREKAAYAALIASRKLPRDHYERWFYFMNSAFCEKARAGFTDGFGAGSPFKLFSDHGFDAGIDGNVTKTVIGFWLRRAMDGTMDSFAEGLGKLLASYAPDLVEHPYRPPPTAKAIDGVLDRATAKAQACTGNAKRATVAVGFQPDGDLDVQVTMPGAALPGQKRPKIVRSPADPQAQCIQQAFHGKVSAFDGGKMTYTRSITFP